MFDRGTDRSGLAGVVLEQTACGALQVVPVGCESRWSTAVGLRLGRTAAELAQELTPDGRLQWAGCRG